MCACTGSAKAFDQGCLIHAIWLQLAQLKCGAWVERVPTEENIADHPSRSALVCGSLFAFRLALVSPLREEYRLLSLLHAERVRPVLEPMFADAKTWEALSIQGVFDRATPGSS